MRRLVNEFKSYLLNKENRTEEENRLLKQCELELQSYPIAYVEAEDLRDVIDNEDNITEENLERIANKMGDYYCNYAFSEDLRDAINYFKL